MKMKRLSDGNYYEIRKGFRGRVYRRMDEREVTEVYAYRAAIVVVPVLMFGAFVLCGGFL